MSLRTAILTATLLGAAWSPARTQDRPDRPDRSDRPLVSPRAPTYRIVSPAPSVRPAARPPAAQQAARAPSGGDSKPPADDQPVKQPATPADQPALAASPPPSPLPANPPPSASAEWSQPTVVSDIAAADAWTPVSPDRSASRLPGGTQSASHVLPGTSGTRGTGATRATNAPAAAPATSPARQAGPTPATTNLQHPPVNRRPRYQLAQHLDDPIPPPPPLPPTPGPATDDARRIRLPLAGGDEHDRIALSGRDDRLSLTVRDASLGSVLNLVAQQHGLNVAASDDVSGRITVTLTDVRLDDALHAILAVNGYTWVRQNNIILVSRLTGDRRVAPTIQGRQTRVFSLNYLAADDVDRVIKGLLSPVGQSFVTNSDPLDKRRTRERIVVEDLPEYLARIDTYLCEVDRPPRQVLIEARVYQVTLREDLRGGVNFDQLLRLAGTNVTLRTAGFGTPTAAPAFFLGLHGHDLHTLAELLESTTDAKTLASPRVLVVNAQEARILIGQSLGYLVTTTTQTSTLQNVDFLESGVVLRVTPVISDDNQILMSVKPEVSSGQINPTTGLPDRETTEVESTILLPSGHGMVIGGLIREIDSDLQAKIPLLGNVWLVGRLFQRRQTVRDRTEIIITLIPHIVPYTPDELARDQSAFARAATPLFTGALDNSHREGLEPRLADAIANPRRLRWDRLHGLFGVFDDYPRPPAYYFPTTGEPAAWPPLLADPWCMQPTHDPSWPDPFDPLELPPHMPAAPGYVPLHAPPAAPSDVLPVPPVPPAPAPLGRTDAWVPRRQEVSGPALAR